MPNKSSKTRHIIDGAEEKQSLPVAMGRKIVVVIGIDTYLHHPPLDNPVSDARAVLELFKLCGFAEIEAAPSLYNKQATRDNISSLVEEQLANSLQPDDSLVLFYAGHGEKIETQVPDPADSAKWRVRRIGYLIPVDARPEKRSGWLKLESFLDDVDGLPARHVLVILDACKSGIALGSKFKVKGQPEPTSVSELRKRVSRRVITSAMHDEKALDGGSGTGNSLFTEALIEAVRNRQADSDGDGFIKSIDLFSYIQDRVSSEAARLYGFKQTPDYGQLSGDGSGDLVLSFEEGTLDRLKKEALAAALNHDMRQLNKLVTRLVAVNADDPTSLYLQYRLKFKLNDLDGALAIIRQLVEAKFAPEAVPLSWQDLLVLSQQLDFWRDLLALESAKPLIKATLWVGPDGAHLSPAVRHRRAGGVIFDALNGGVAQWVVVNLSEQPLYLYNIVITPHGRLRVGPLPTENEYWLNGIPPGKEAKSTLVFVKGVPKSVAEMRLFVSPKFVRLLDNPPPTAARELILPGEFAGIEMMRFLYRA